MEVFIEPFNFTCFGISGWGINLDYCDTETNKPFRYDLNQMLYDYTVEVTNRFKGLDLIECLKNYGWSFLTLCWRQ